MSATPNRRELVIAAIRSANGNRAEAARSLGITRMGLTYWIRQLGLTDEDIPKAQRGGSRQDADAVLVRHYLAVLAGCGDEGKEAARILGPIVMKAKNTYGSFTLYVSRLVEAEARHEKWL